MASAKARRDILDAAQRLYRQGEGFTMEALAAEAGVSRATLYRRFGGRESLAEALLEERSLVVGEHDLRARVLGAAGRVFTARGIARATVEQVAAEAGVGAATIYRHFGDREGLITAFVDRSSFSRDIDRVRQESSGDLDEDLRSIVSVALAFVAGQGALIRLALSPEPEAAELMGRLRTRTGNTRQRVAELLAQHQQAGALPADLDALALTYSLMSLILGHALMLPLLDHREPWADDAGRDALAGHLVALFLDGVRGRSKEAP